MLKATRVALGSTPSSKAWVSRQLRDPYVKHRLDLRSRSAFKLLEIEAQHNFIDKPHVRGVVDLGAAPGGWSQIVSRKLGWSRERSAPMRAPSGKDLKSASQKSTRKARVETLDDDYDPLNIDDELHTLKGRGTIVAVDLLPMVPIPGVRTLKGDFLAPSTVQKVRTLLATSENPGGKADIILSDMAANASGTGVRDIQSSLDICESVYSFAARNLRSMQETGDSWGGVLLIKYFAHPLLEDFSRENLQPNFRKVHLVKPPASRSDSRETYFLCMGFKGGEEPTPITGSEFGLLPE
ncbi:23S ribosomal RNA methyltransferase [Schizophyllum commune H4-8]|uniref:23S ribosomal RNA methyltransferase n=1 Tax=Schizophyllum commune (strain H4-8 / FGSC 9210) TaxID=578458 RepID=UPI00215DED57|nr:23S ribosomal RNA methyltransferase [Schizophyllum commune H4-8]KAI5886675.1 23S ribosomal RNA methyltransferase [Schizophyllum commune H4-8]